MDPTMACIRRPVDFPDDDDPEKTDPLLRTDLPLFFAPATRSYHYLPADLPDEQEIAETILRTEALLGSPDAKAIRDAGIGAQLTRLTRMISTHGAAGIVRAFKNAFYGDPH